MSTRAPAQHYTEEGGASAPGAPTHPSSLPVWSAAEMPPAAVPHSVHGVAAVSFVQADYPEELDEFGRELDELEVDAGEEEHDFEAPHEPALVATFDAGRILRGMVNAFAQACRDGVVISHLAHMSTVASGDGHVYVNVGQDRSALLESQISDANRRREKAFERMMKTADERKAADFEAEYDRTLKELEGLEADVAALKQPQTPRTDTRVETYSDLIAAALVGLLESNNQITQRQRQALNLVMPDFRIHRDGNDQWHASATIRLATTDGGVAELGPISWQLGAGGRGSGLRAGPSRSAVEPALLDTLLRKTGAVSRDGLAVLRNAVFPELRHVVLHGLTGRAMPEWVGPQWREPAFVAWVTKVYSDPNLKWKNGAYALFSAQRQFLAHVCSQRDLVTIEELADMIPFARNSNLTRLTHVYPTKTGAYHPPVRRGRRTRWITVDGRRRVRSTWGFESIRCECGQAAHVAVRVPEVPRSLLCTCGRMPEATDFGMPQDVRFPDEYARVLCLSLEACEAEIRNEFALKEFTPHWAATLLLEQLRNAPDGLTATELKALTGLHSSVVYSHLRRLSAHAVIEAPSREEVARGGRWRIATDPTPDSLRQPTAG